MQLKVTSEHKAAYLLRKNKRLFNAIVHHRNTKGQNLTFFDRPYVMDIYNDFSKEIVVMKSVQCGISEWLIVDTLTACENGLSVFYVLPKYTLRNTFVANRVDKLFNMVPFYRKQMKGATGDADSTEIKHYASGTIKFASSNTISDFGEFPADMVVIDELDRCDQNNIAMAADRLKASSHRLVRKVGNPTIQNFGIHDEFKNSDQKEWNVKCGHCGKWQALDFFKQIVREVSDGIYELIDSEWTFKEKRDINCFCVKCGEPIDRLTKEARWIPENPGYPVSGYHMNRICEPNTQISELWLNWQKAQGNESKKQIFFNSDLGVPYESKGAKITEYSLDLCCSDYVMPPRSSGCVAGVDVGAVLNVKISRLKDDLRIAQYIGTVPRFEDLDTLIKLYGVECMVVDALPETHKAKELRERQKGIVWLCEFVHREGSTRELALNHEDHKVMVDRTESMDDSHADVLLKKIVLPKGARDIDDGAFYSQMCASTRIFDQEKNRYVWREGSKADHYRLADNYEKIASRIITETRVKAWDL